MGGDPSSRTVKSVGPGMGLNRIKRCTAMKERLKARDRKASIIQLSKRLFARKGLHGVSVGELAKACGVSAGVLYQHFPSKDALYQAVLDEFACSRDAYIDAVLTGPAEFGDVLYRTMLVYVKSRVRDVDSVRIELRSLIDGDKASKTFFANQWKGFIEYIEVSLSDLIKENAIPATDVRLAALCYVGMVRELILSRAFKMEDAYKDAPLEDVVKEMHVLFLRLVGLSATGPSSELS